MRVLKLAAGLSAGVFATAVGLGAQAAELLGQPTPGAIDMQPGASSLRHQQMFFHDGILLPITTAITLFVLGLLIYCMVRFNKRANPTPARWSHNTMVEVVWTVVPVLILMFIAIFSFKLLYAFHELPKADVTVKVTGSQWYWTYEYPDLKVGEYTSIMLPEDEAKKQGVPYRLAATEPLVAPVNANVRVEVTAADVIHAFAMPAFGIKIDAIPGRMNQTWFKAERVGTYYGQCSELCGVDHAFMPIMIKVVTQPEFDAWVASKGGAVPGAPTPAAAPAAEPAAAPAPTKTSAVRPASKAAPARLQLAAY